LLCFCLSGQQQDKAAVSSQGANHKQGYLWSYIVTEAALLLDCSNNVIKNFQLGYLGNNGN
jgi:hypothetical protein